MVTSGKSSRMLTSNHHGIKEGQIVLSIIDSTKIIAMHQIILNLQLIHYNVSRITSSTNVS